MSRNKHFFLTFIVFTLGLREDIGGVSNGPEHDCRRPCDGQSTPMTCFYRFRMGISQRLANDRMFGRIVHTNTRARLFISINEKWPPPLVEVCQNDTIVVEVMNRLPFGIETAFHWHGLTDGNSPFMDGVPMITQCPIHSHLAFTYRLKAHKNGTFFYRAHSVEQHLDGVVGPLIVHDEKDQALSTQTMVVSELLNDLQTIKDGYETDLNVVALQLVVYNHSTYQDDGCDPALLRLRIVNACALNCPITLSSVSIPFTVVAVDGSNVKSNTTTQITLYPGERIDILATESIIQSAKILGREICKNHIKFGLSGGISEFRNDTEETESHSSDVSSNFVPASPENLAKGDFSLFLPYDMTVLKDFDGRVDFRFKLGGLTTYTPSFLVKKKIKFYQTNNKTFLYPPSPLLSQPNDIPEDIKCSLQEPSTRCYNDNSDYCECLGIINLPYNKNLNLFIIDEGKNSNESLTIHIHGYTFHVLGSKTYGRPVTAEEVKMENSLGKISKNLINPIKKDSVVVPNKGFVLLRLKLNNPGTWLIESTSSKARWAAGFEFVLNVERPDKDLKPPKNFPKCGTLKGPDLVIID